MSEFDVRVVRVGRIEKHPDPDTTALSVTKVYDDYPCILRTGEFAEGELAVYVPVDSIVPDEPRWAFLKGQRRIRPRKIRGVFSMGLLVKPDPTWPEGFDACDALRITKYDADAAAEAQHGENAADPGCCPVFDVPGLRRFKSVLVPGEEVWATEKIHGQTGRFVWHKERFRAGSGTFFKKLDGTSTWAQVAQRYQLAEKLKPYPDIAIYGEVYGNNPRMSYGVKRSEGDRLMLFDVLDCKTRRWFDVDECLNFAEKLGLPVVPTLYRGPWKPELVSLAEGKTTVPDADHVREGVVIKPVRNREHHEIGRVLLKLHGEGFLLSKGA